MVFNQFLKVYKITKDVGEKKIIILRDLENKMLLSSAIVKVCEYIMTHHCTFSYGPYYTGCGCVYLIKLCINGIQMPYTWDLFGQGKKDI